jgi:DNA modification methylase
LLILGDCIEVLKTLPAESVNCCVTSPPYFGLRSYLPDGVRLKHGAPGWVIEELENIGIMPIDLQSCLL